MKNYIFSHYEKINNDLFDGIHEFIISIIRNVPDSQLYFFTNIEDTYKNDRLNFISLDNFNTYYNCACDRYFIYLDYLLNNSFDEDSNFVFCDCRDLIFLSNIFDKLDRFTNNCVIFGYEYEKITLKLQETNKLWLQLQNSYNIQKFGDKNIVCSGCFIIKGYEMAKLFFCYITSFMKYYINILNIYGLNDQGLLNELYYNFLLNYEDRFIVLNNEQNDLFYHLCITPKTEFSFNNGKLKQIKNGIEPSIIHQYDRYPELVKLIKEIYK